MPKRLKTYRLDPGECADFASAVRITGETETSVLRTAIRAYIQRVLWGDSAPPAPVAAPPVYTAADTSASYDEPAAESCKHPAEAVEANECGICHADVW